MDTNHRNRKPTRLRGFDYTQRRSYFVTVCTQDRCEILADICRGGALLLPIGEIVEREIKALSEKYGNLVDRYVIMPNHIHLLLNLCAQTQGVSLCDIVCALKSRTTKLANEFNRQPGRQIWQRSFHDHIVRDERDYLKIRQYIDENPMRWEQDCFYQRMELGKTETKHL